MSDNEKNRVNPPAQADDQLPQPDPQLYNYLEEDVKPDPRLRNVISKADKADSGKKN